MMGFIVIVLIGVLIWFVSYSLPRRRVRRLLDQLGAGQGVSQGESAYLVFIYLQQCRIQQIPWRRTKVGHMFGLYDWLEINEKTIIRPDLATTTEMMFLPPDTLQSIIDRRHPSVASEIADIKQLLASSELGEKTELASRIRQRLLNELDALRRTPSEALERFSVEVDESISYTQNVRKLFGNNAEDTGTNNA